MSGEIFDILDKPEYELLPGIKIRPVYLTDEFMAALFIIDNEVPKHKHVNIQFGIVLKGKGILILGDKKMEVSSNTFYYIPSNIYHSIIVLESPLYALDFFLPPREDYMKFFK